ncbi:MAG: cbb3-type cytochrome oxidase assembly protein CcoS [Epsilonproteobacteria bacterium]|nr:cbb3-type cytochrome oxidase assembly protein CcoS [Campylobacterota bacterium]
MSSSIIAMMLGVSIFLGALGLIGFLWALKSGQFDDKEKFFDGARYDGEEELKDAIMMEQKRKEILKKRKKEYRPQD